MRTGDVTTAELTDATPAVLASHVASRSCQGPADMASCPQDRKSAGGQGSIAEQMLAHDVDVLMGGGAARFDQQMMEDGRSPVQEAIAYPANAGRPQVCKEDNRPAGEPSLAEMTEKAIELLDRPSGPGFF